MKRILSLLACVAIATLVGTGVASAAQKNVRHHASTRVAAVSASQAMDAGSYPVSNPALCGSSCPLRSSASAVTASAPAKAKAAKAAYSYNGKACPVSDPSQCPASCPRTSASTAVAAKVSSR